MRIAALVASLALCAAATSPMAPLLAENSPSRVPGEYVVIFEEQVTDKDGLLVYYRAGGTYPTGPTYSFRHTLSYHDNKTNFIKNKYHIGNFRGYGAMMDDKLRDIVRSMKHIQYIECSQYYHADCKLQTDATWGIVRTTYIDNPGSLSDYTYRADGGHGVDIYIIDSGIYTEHPDFGGRAIWGVDFVDSPSPRTDLNGHGTHVAGTVMSNTWGLAKRGTAIAVRVLDQAGWGTTSGIISGVHWVVSQHKYGAKSIANMSLGGGRSTALNKAVEFAVENGIHVVVAAGNEGQNACTVSPASATTCVTVGASDSSDQFAYFSNYGNCVDIIGPGVGITSTWLDDETNIKSGTSMAAPHVAGVMAKYLTDQSLTPEQMKTLLTESATKDKISGALAGTPNDLVFKDCP